MIGRLWLYKSPHSWWTWNTTQFNRLWGRFCCSTFPIESLNHNIPIPCSNFLRLSDIWLSSLFFEIPPKKNPQLKKHNKTQRSKGEKKQQQTHHDISWECPDAISSDALSAWEPELLRLPDKWLWSYICQTVRCQMVPPNLDLLEVKVVSHVVFLAPSASVFFGGWGKKFGGLSMEGLELQQRTRWGWSSSHIMSHPCLVFCRPENSFMVLLMPVAAS